MLRVLLPLLAATAAFAAPAIVKRQTAPVTPALIVDLETADSAVERNQILVANGGNASFVFDFAHPPAGAVAGAGSGSVGNVTLASAATAPFLVGLDAALALAQVGPCGLVLPHIHPRADEFIIVTEGQFFTQFITENGASLITNTLNQWGSTIFPKGSIHLEWNPTCHPASFVAAFNSNDPGISFVASNFVGLDDPVVIAALGGDGIVSGADLDSIRQHLPPPVAVAVESCLSSCGISKRSLNDFGK
jgi:hypothetical protein